jgi:hypothetical protein
MYRLPGDRLILTKDCKGFTAGTVCYAAGIPDDEESGDSTVQPGSCQYLVRLPDRLLRPYRPRRQLKVGGVMA